MTVLRLRVDIGEKVGKSFEHNVVANIYDISDGKGKRRDIRDLIIPVGDEKSKDFKDVELDPGQYIVEAILPSGKTIRKELLLKKSKMSQKLLLETEQTSREWLGWQYFIGNVQQDAESYERLKDSTKLKTTDNIVAGIMGVCTLPRDRVGVSNSSALASRGYFFALRSSDIAELKDFKSGPVPIRGLDPPVEIINLPNPDHCDEISNLYSFDPNPDSYKIIRFYPRYEHYEVGRHYKVDRYKRYYLFIDGEGIPTQYSVLPIPWNQSDRSGSSTVDVLVNRIHMKSDISSVNDPGFRTSITVHDRHIGSVIGYLGAGGLPTAATIVNDAKMMLFKKNKNPLAAAAGAYVLVCSEDSYKCKPWHKWVRNLMNWFPWLPDGAILYAWLKLNHKKSDEDILNARKDLLEGFRRGLPFYSKGVSLLLDGLTLFANDAKLEDKKDKKVEYALKKVQILAMRTDMRQPFTTVLL